MSRSLHFLPGSGGSGGSRPVVVPLRLGAPPPGNSSVEMFRRRTGAGSSASCEFEAEAAFPFAIAGAEAEAGCCGSCGSGEAGSSGLAAAAAEARILAICGERRGLASTSPRPAAVGERAAEAAAEEEEEVAGAAAATAETEAKAEAAALKELGAAGAEAAAASTAERVSASWMAEAGAGAGEEAAAAAAAERDGAAAGFAAATVVVIVAVVVVSGFGPIRAGPMGESCVIGLPSAVVRLAGLVQVAWKPGGTTGAAAAAVTAASASAAATSSSLSAASIAAEALAHSTARALASPPAAKAASAASSSEESVVESRRSAAEVGVEAGCFLFFGFGFGFGFERERKERGSEKKRANVDFFSTTLSPATRHARSFFLFPFAGNSNPLRLLRHAAAGREVRAGLGDGKRWQKKMSMLKLKKKTLRDAKIKRKNAALTCCCWASVTVVDPATSATRATSRKARRAMVVF